MTRKHIGEYQLSENHRKHISEALIGKHLTEEAKRKIGEFAKNHTGWHHSEETKKKLSESNKGKHIISEETREKLCIARRGRITKDETRRKLSIAGMGKHHYFLGKTLSEEHKHKVSNGLKEYYKTHKIHMEESTKKKLSKSVKELWKNPEFRENIKIGMAKRSEKMVERYKNDKEFKDRVVSACHKALAQRPTKPELDLQSILDTTCPNQYKYTGDGGMVINGLCPDFTNCNGQKKVIECYGDYWHKDDKPQDRINKYGEFGFDCLIIWASELHYKKNLSKRITKFNEGQNSFALQHNKRWL